MLNEQQLFLWFHWEAITKFYCVCYYGSGGKVSWAESFYSRGAIWMDLGDWELKQKLFIFVFSSWTFFLIRIKDMQHLILISTFTHIDPPHRLHSSLFHVLTWCLSWRTQFNNLLSMKFSLKHMALIPYSQGNCPWKTLKNFSNIKHTDILRGNYDQ